MQKNKLVIGLSLTILVGLWGGGLAYAESASSSSQNSKNNVDTVKTQNKRQNAQQSARKLAAAHLKAKYKAARANEIAQQVIEHGHQRSSK
ncbi:MAG: hypothetical protein HOP02_01850 [Methylococcaceae bacterium]|nr:hypothetical protein [Methylococcaceae bacterium]